MALTAKGDKMRELLDGYRTAVECAEAVELANMLRDEGSTDEHLALIWLQVGTNPERHRRTAKRYKDLIVVANRGLIRIVAKNVLGVASRNADNLAEAEQEGAMGVMRAVDAYDPDRGLWSICAKHWIRYYVQTCAHRQTDFPRQRHQRMPPEVAKQANIVRARVGREPVHSELTWKGDAVTLEQWRAWTERAQLYSFELANTQNETGDLNHGKEDLIADEKSSPDLVIANADFNERIKACIAEMSPRNREIMTALFIEGENPGEVFERFHIDKRRVSEIKAILSDRLKQVLSS